MKKGFCFLLLLFCTLLIFSCKSKHGATGITVTSDTVRFYPATEYFNDQVKKVAASNSYIYEITINDKKVRDSVALSKQQFMQLAQTFLAVDISDKSIHKYYKENIFMDETTHSYTFNYTAMDSTLPLQSMDVLLDAGDQQVTRVFLNRSTISGDSTITEKAGWRTNSSFFINRIVDYADGRTTTQQNIIVWRNRP